MKWFHLENVDIQSWRLHISHYYIAYVFGPLSLQYSWKTINARNIAAKDTTLQQVEDETVLINSFSFDKMKSFTYAYSPKPSKKGFPLRYAYVYNTVIITVYNTDQSDIHELAFTHQPQNMSFVAWWTVNVCGEKPEVVCATLFSIDYVCLACLSIRPITFWIHTLKADTLV